MRIVIFEASPGFITRPCHKIKTKKGSHFSSNWVGSLTALCRMCLIVVTLDRCGILFSTFPVGSFHLSQTKAVSVAILVLFLQCWFSYSWELINYSINMEKLWRSKKMGRVFWACFSWVFLVSLQRFCGLSELCHCAWFRFPLLLPAESRAAPLWFSVILPIKHGIDHPWLAMPCAGCFDYGYECSRALATELWIKGQYFKTLVHGSVVSEQSNRSSNSIKDRVRDIKGSDVSFSRLTVHGVFSIE